jgi:hypothetical protein
MKSKKLMHIFSTLFIFVIHGVAAAGDAWKYDTDMLKLGQTRATALVTSTQSLDLKFPYQGFNFGAVQIGKYSSGKSEVIFAVDKGQIVCAYGGCNIQIMFGSEKPENYLARLSSDGQSNILFIQSKDKFISKVKKFQQFSIQVTLYQNGPKIVTFNTDQLKWK